MPDTVYSIFKHKFFFLFSNKVIHLNNGNPINRLSDVSYYRVLELVIQKLEVYIVALQYLLELS